MTTTPRKLSISQLTLYNPSRLSDEEIVASFAARQAVFDRIMADIASEKLKSRAQHHLIVGQRGMGKSTLLARIAAELRTKPELSAVYIPLVFAEEQYAVDRLSKFWLNCLDSLADACEKIGDTVAPKRIDDLVRKLESRPGSTAALDEGQSDILDAFLAEARTLQRRPVLLVDNLQLVFERISEQQQHVLRELLMRPGGPLLVAASPSPPPESQDYGAAFYDHFKTHYLPPLSVAEMRQLMLTLAEKFGNTTIRDRITRHPHRLSVLRQLTGGNPRTTVTLFFLYAEDFADTVFGDLENLLDRVTPLYKARFEELSTQQQVVASAIANHWDPVTARQLADATSLPITGISPQLDRLERIGFIERVALFEESSTGYQIAERFFNVWFLMRSSSRRKKREVEFLTRFIESFYEADDRSRLAQKMLAERNLSPDRHLWARALAGTLNEGEGRDLRRHTELDALRQTEAEARRQLEDVIDFSQLPPAAIEFDDLRKKLVSLVPSDAGIAPDEFARKVLGDRNLFKSGDRNRLAARQRLTNEDVRKVLASIAGSARISGSPDRKDAAEWLAKRLESGRLAGLHELGDWIASIGQAPTPECVQLLIDTIPPSIGAKLPDHAIARVREVLCPGASASAEAWFNWGYSLHVVLARYDEAESAYRKAIALDDSYAYAWNNLGNLLKNHTGRYEEAESAYRKAIALDDSYAYAWNNLGNLLKNHTGRYEEAESAYRKAIALDDSFVYAWCNLGNLLHYRTGRYKEAEPAYHKAISLDDSFVYAWCNLGNLLKNHTGRYEEAESAYHKAIALDGTYAYAWNGLGNLCCDFLNRMNDAAQAFERACDLDPNDEFPRHNLLFLHRDFLGEGISARPRFEQLLALPRPQIRDTVELHHSLFAAYEENWGKAREALVRALDLIPQGFPSSTIDDWYRASAVLLHLNYGEQLLAFLRERGDDARLRPWYEALVALHKGDRRFLQNLAPEVRTTAEVYFDQIEKRLNALPEKTRRRPLPKPAKTKPTRGRKRS